MATQVVSSYPLPRLKEGIVSSLLTAHVIHADIVAFEFLSTSTLQKQICYSNKMSLSGGINHFFCVKS